MRFPLGLSLVITALLAGCQDWEGRSAVSQAVWSDDNASVALTVARWEEENVGLFGNTRSLRHQSSQLYTWVPGSIYRTAITPQMPVSARDLYYMTVPRYFLLTYPLNVTEFASDIIGPNGVRKLLARSTGNCESQLYDAVPSSSGNHVAVVTSIGCGGILNLPDSVVVRLFYATTLTLLRTDTVSTPGGSTSTVHWTWRSVGDFVVAGPDGAFSMASGRAKTVTTMPRCFYPKTSSSDRSSRGTQLVKSQYSEFPSIGTTDPSIAFGCQ